MSHKPWSKPWTKPWTLNWGLTLSTIWSSSHWDYYTISSLWFWFQIRCTIYKNSQSWVKVSSLRIVNCLVKDGCFIQVPRQLDRKELLPHWSIEKTLLRFVFRETSSLPHSSQTNGTWPRRTMTSRQKIIWSPLIQWSTANPSWPTLTPSFQTPSGTTEFRKDPNASRTSGKHWIASSTLKLLKLIK